MTQCRKPWDFWSVLFYSPTRTIEQKVMSLIRGSTKLVHLLQIHSFTIKSSLDCNNVILSKFLARVFSCSSPNDFSYAWSVFGAIPSPDTFIWNTMIRAYLNSQNPHQSLSLFSQMHLQEGVFIDSFSFSLVLQACGRSIDNLNGRIIHTKVLKHGFGSDLFVQTALIEMYAKCGFIDIGRKIFNEICNPDIVSYNALLAEYVNVGEISSAQELFDKMPERDLVSWNTVIHAYASFGELEEKNLSGRTCEITTDSWTSVTLALSKYKQSNEALRLFHEMQLEHVVPDTITLVSVLLACRNVGSRVMGKTVHGYIERNTIEIDIKLGTALVDMYAKCGDINNSMRVFSRLNKKDVFAWSAMIMGLANHGLGALALNHFSKMISEQIKPNDITFIGVLTACSRIGLVEKGWTYFKSMSCVYGISPKLEHYGCMVDILARAGQVQEAKGLIENLPFAPDAIVWRALLGAGRIQKNVQLANEATMNILELETHMDGT